MIHRKVVSVGCLAMSFHKQPTKESIIISFERLRKIKLNWKVKKIYRLERKEGKCKTCDD